MIFSASFRLFARKNIQAKQESANVVRICKKDFSLGNLFNPINSSNLSLFFLLGLQKLNRIHLMLPR
jgi:hypothetical protein